MKEKILILVKTYPTFSQKYFELVCTAGINEKGEWRRIYPIPFRDLPELEKYKKYQWVEVNIERDSFDSRPESFKLKLQFDIQDQAAIRLLEKVDTKNSWQKRRDVLFKKTKVYDDLEEIIEEAHKNEISLCTFKPAKVIDFKVKEVEREWNTKILNQIEQENRQGALLPDLKREVKLVKKLPYKFSYQFKDIRGKTSTLMIEDWEIGQLYWNCLKRKNNNEKQAIKDVIEKYKDSFLSKKDIHLFLGTTRQFHIRKAKNPYIIIGVFYPPKAEQETLF